MDTSNLKKFAQNIRRSLIEQVTTKLGYVLASDSIARRENAEAIAELEKQIKIHSKEQVIEKVAYAWFNRFCALRFMDVNGYNRIGIISPAAEQSQPEILAEAKMGHIDEDMVSKKMQQQIVSLFNGDISSRDPQGEVYRLLLVSACNDYHRAMPYLFERIADYTELLLPDDLLSENSILAQTRQAMTLEVCQDVEAIGWLYQYYISEKKDEVFAALKKNKKITPKNIPAATQLFTPNWIVRYLVDNSLGRLWMLNRPQSKLVERMDYYIKPEATEDDFLRIDKPEEIKVCDPACGSGHLLVYAFDLLYAIYEEEGYTPSEIPEKILTHNLYGIEIDERAGELAAFALTMKAREKYRRFLRKPVQPHICVLENVTFHQGEIRQYLDYLESNVTLKDSLLLWQKTSFVDLRPKDGQSQQLELITTETKVNLLPIQLQNTLRQFEEADNFGSLIRPEVTEVGAVRQLLEDVDVSGQIFLYNIHKKMCKVLKYAEFLGCRYHVVIANPPYMGSKGMNPRLSAWAKDNYPDSKSDLFAIFTERIMEMVQGCGFIGLMTPFTWMFLSSYEKLRSRILNENTITSLVRPEYHAFFESAYVPICAFTLFRKALPTYRGAFIDLQKFYGADVQPVKTIEAIKNPDCGWFYRTSANDFKKIPGKAIAYWVSDRVRNIFEKMSPLAKVTEARVGLMTSDNDQFLRFFWEVSKQLIFFDASTSEEAENSRCRWFPHNKGGAFRKWAGNYEYLVDWENNGQRIKETVVKKYSYLKGNPNFVVHDDGYYFKPFVSWSEITSSALAFRYFPQGFTFNVKGMSVFPTEDCSLEQIIMFSNTKFVSYIVKALNPTISFGVGNFNSLPAALISHQEIEQNVTRLINYAKKDWNSYETSWDFTTLPLLNPDYHQCTLKDTYIQLRHHWQEMTLEMQQLEEENNRIFIEAYGLQDELTPEVPLKEITLTCNPYYRYGDKTETELEALLLTDTMKEFISYAVGCIFGRYSLDKPGLILANQGETITDYLKQIPEPTFTPDQDNVIPILDGDWFIDDITDRFRQFLRVTFGQENYETNLTFIEKAIGKNIRNYFLKDFYNDHIKRYKKRPIYWLFSSPNGNFNALIYLHRYRPDTVSIVLNDYLREFRAKLGAKVEHLKQVEVSANVSSAEKTKAIKEIEKLNKIIKEMDDYERDVLYPLAIQQIQIDLDDGVKVNYPKFGKALKKIAGLEQSED